MDLYGAAWSNARQARSTRRLSADAPLKRDHEKSNPSITELSDGDTESDSASNLKYSMMGPRVRATPNPWLLCMLRLSAASSPMDILSRGLKPPTSSFVNTERSSPGLRF